MKKLIEKILAESIALPECVFVPSDITNFKARLGREWPKWCWKLIKRKLLFYSFGQLFGLVRYANRLPAVRSRILWINLSAPSLGDCLMDLASISLLTRYHDVWLLTHPKNKELCDLIDGFQAVFDSVDEVNHSMINIDFIICDSFAPRVLAKKCSVGSSIPFVGLYGFVNGFEVHRTIFSYARMYELLEYSEPLVGISSAPLKFERRAKASYMVLAVGGEWDFRTYRRWNKVLCKILNKGMACVLVGSINGVEESLVLSQEFTSVTNLVGKTAISEVVSLIGNAQLFLGCDGGLWHIANSVGTPSVALFADCQIFAANGDRVTREPPDAIVRVLYAPSNVNEIHPECVVSAVEDLLTEKNRFDYY